MGTNFLCHCIFFKKTQQWAHCGLQRVASLGIVLFLKTQQWAHCGLQRVASLGFVLWWFLERMHFKPIGIRKTILENNFGKQVWLTLKNKFGKQVWLTPIYKLLVWLDLGIAESRVGGVWKLILFFTHIIRNLFFFVIMVRYRLIK